MLLVLAGAAFLGGSGHAPPVLLGTLASASTVELRWLSVGVARFDVERSADGATFTLLATLPGSARAFTDRGVPGGTTFSYRVGGFRGDLRYSNVVQVTTPWAATYGTAGNEDALSVRAVPGGGLVVAGQIDPFGTYEWDAWVLRLAADGGVTWQKSIGSAAGEWADHVIPARDGGFLLVGECNWAPGNGDAWVVKLSSAGAVEWQRAFGGPDYEEFLGAVQTRDGGYLLSGYTFSFGAGGSDLWLVKVSGAGALEWQRTYGGPLWEGAGYGLSVIQTRDGGYAVATAAAGTDPFLPQGSDIWVLKLERNGDVDWEATYGGAGEDLASCIVETPGGGFLVLADTTSFGAGGHDFWILRLDDEGDVRWQKTYGGPWEEFAYWIHRTRNNEILVAGTSDSFGAGDVDFWLLRLRANGAILWQKAYGGPGHEWVYAMQVAETPDGGIALAGSTLSAGSGGADAVVLKLAQDGTISFNRSSPLRVATTFGRARDTGVEGEEVESRVGRAGPSPAAYPAVVQTTFATPVRQAP